MFYQGCLLLSFITSNNLQQLPTPFLDPMTGDNSIAIVLLLLRGVAAVNKVFFLGVPDKELVVANSTNLASIYVRYHTRFLLHLIWQNRVSLICSQRTAWPLPNVKKRPNFCFPIKSLSTTQGPAALAPFSGTNWMYDVCVYPPRHMMPLWPLTVRTPQDGFSAPIRTQNSTKKE